MKLRKFEVKNYRSCLHTTLIIPQQLSVLIGINGAGKSNILSAIVLLKKIIQRSRYIHSKYSESLSHCQIKFELEYEMKTIFAKCEVFYETDERNLDDVQYSSLKWNFKEITGKSKWYEISPGVSSIHYPIQIPIEFNDQPEELYKFFKYRESYPKLILPLIQQVGLFLNGINYYSASQFSDPSKCPISIELDENRPIRKIRNNNLGHEQFILDLFRSYESKSDIYKRYFNTVSKAGLGLIEGIEFNKVDMPTNTIEIKTGGRIKKIARTRSIVVPNFIVDGVNLSPNQLSEGTLKTLALLFYTLTDDSKLLLIEEPEVCIHHGLLNSIISIIKSQSKNKQIIISTHSDYVLDLLVPENIVLVRKEEGKCTTAKLLSNAISKNDYKALRTYLLESGNLGEYWRESGFGNN